MANISWADRVRNEVWRRGRTEVMRRRGEIRKQLLNERKETREYWKVKEGILYRALWKSRFRRQNAE
jgi:hypothetical protein